MSEFIIEKTGDIFTSKANAVGHGINVKGAMAAGIAAQFAQRYPTMREDYWRACEHGEIMPGDCWVWYEEYHPDFEYVFNIASQNFPGPDARMTWLSLGLNHMYQMCMNNNIFLVALPQIGCGIGGLRWEPVKALITDYAKYFEVTTELWTFEPRAAYKAA